MNGRICPRFLPHALGHALRPVGSYAVPYACLSIRMLAAPSFLVSLWAVIQKCIPPHYRSFWAWTMRGAVVLYSVGGFTFRSCSGCYQHASKGCFKLWCHQVGRITMGVHTSARASPWTALRVTRTNTQPCLQRASFCGRVPQSICPST